MQQQAGNTRGRSKTVLCLSQSLGLSQTEQTLTCLKLQLKIQQEVQQSQQAQIAQLREELSSVQHSLGEYRAAQAEGVQTKHGNKPETHLERISRYTHNLTIHGLCIVFDRAVRPLERAVWFLLFLVALTAAVLISKDFVVLYFNGDTQYIYKIKAIDSLKLPTMAVCSGYPDETCNLLSNNTFDCPGTRSSSGPAIYGSGFNESVNSIGVNLLINMATRHDLMSLEQGVGHKCVSININATEVVNKPLDAISSVSIDVYKGNHNKHVYFIMYEPGEQFIYSDINGYWLIENTVMNLEFRKQQIHKMHNCTTDSHYSTDLASPNIFPGIYTEEKCRLTCDARWNLVLYNQTVTCMHRWIPQFWIDKLVGSHRSENGYHKCIEQCRMIGNPCVYNIYQMTTDTVSFRADNSMIEQRKFASVRMY